MKHRALSVQWTECQRIQSSLQPCVTHNGRKKCCALDVASVTLTPSEPFLPPRQVSEQDLVRCVRWSKEGDLFCGSLTFDAIGVLLICVIAHFKATQPRRFLLVHDGWLFWLCPRCRALQPTTVPGPASFNNAATLAARVPSMGTPLTSCKERNSRNQAGGCSQRLSDRGNGSNLQGRVFSADFEMHE